MQVKNYRLYFSNPSFLFFSSLLTIYKEPRNSCSRWIWVGLFLSPVTWCYPECVIKKTSTKLQFRLRYSQLIYFCQYFRPIRINESHKYIFMWPQTLKKTSNDLSCLIVQINKKAWKKQNLSAFFPPFEAASVKEYIFLAAARDWCLKLENKSICPRTS